MSAVVLLGALLLCCSAASASPLSVDVLRMARYETAGGELRGAHPFDSSHEYELASSFAPTSTWLRRLVVVPWETVECAAQLEAIVAEKGAAGVLVVVPAQTVQSTRWAGVERDLLRTSLVRAPVFFTRSPVLDDALLPQGEDGYGLFGDRWVATQHARSKQHRCPEGSLTNLQGSISPSPSVDDRLNQQPSGGSNRPHRTVAIVANYDTFAVAPAAHGGTKANGSGVAALLALARAFNHVASTEHNYTDGDGEEESNSWRLLFVLTAAGPFFGHEGAAQWIKAADPDIVKSLVFALSLDSLAGDDRLVLHVSHDPGNSSGPIADFYRRIAEAAKLADLPFSIDNGTTSAAHGPFVARKIPAGTLSSGESIATAMTSLLDTRKQVDGSLLQRQVVVLGDALYRQLYNVPPSSSLLLDKVDVSKSYLDSWLDVLSSVPRGTNVLMSNTNSTIVSMLEAELGVLCNQAESVRRMPFHLSSAVLYTSTDDDMPVLTIVRTKTFVFHLALLLAVVAYLVLFRLFITILPF